jgi:arylsulfatase B
MTSHQKLEETNAVVGEDQPVLKKDEKRVCSLWMVIAIFLTIVVIIMILYICGVFDNLTDTANESGAAGATTEDENLSIDVPYLKEDESNNNEGSSYLTGDTPPNMIFLIADDIGWADISHNGGEFSTPNIDAILEEGIEFTRFYSHHLCTPSRMAFLTGRLAWKLGSQYAEELHGMMTGHIPAGEKTYAEVTREMGYENYYLGRWGVGYASWDMTPLGRGWDKFMGYFGPEGGYYNHTTDHFGEWIGVYDMWDMKKPFINANMTYSEDLFLERSLTWLEEARLKGNPFTLTYAAQTAHAPIDDDWPTFYPPTTWAECVQENPSYIGREYYCNKVKYLDYNWGVIVEYLKGNGMWENTLIFMTTDNGALPYSHQTIWSDWGCNWPLRSGKVTNYEGGVKVWAGMSGGLIPPDLRGSTLDELTHIVDLAATAMRLSMTLDQYNKRGTLTGTSKIVDGNNLFLFEHHELLVHNVLPQSVPTWVYQGDNDYALTDGEWKYYIGFDSSSAQGPGWYNVPELGIITIDNEPTIFATAGGYCTQGCLFHLVTDPSEFKDVSKTYPEISSYFADVIGAIFEGGFDKDYHPGQPYDEDYRGYQADNILRPYLDTDAIADYEARKNSTSSNFTYDYATYHLSWDGDYDGTNSPFGDE